MHHIAVLNDVRLPFLPHLTGFFGFPFRTILNKILVRDCLRADESSLKIRVNHSGGLRSGPPDVDRPCADFLDARGEVRRVAEAVVRSADQSVQPGGFDAEVFQKGLRFIRSEILQIFFDLRLADDAFVVR